MSEVTPFQRKLNREAEVKVLESLQAKGMVITDFSPQERARMRDKLQPVTDKYTREVGESLVREMQAEIKKVRGEK